VLAPGDFGFEFFNEGVDARWHRAVVVARAKHGEYKKVSVEALDRIPCAHGRTSRRASSHAAISQTRYPMRPSESRVFVGTSPSDLRRSHVRRDRPRASTASGSLRTRTKSGAVWRRGSDENLSSTTWTVLSTRHFQRGGGRG